MSRTKGPSEEIMDAKTTSNGEVESPRAYNEDEAIASLYGKLARIAGGAQSVVKDSYNSFLKYHYASPSAVFNAIKPLFEAERLAILPRIDAVQTSEAGKSGAGNSNVRTLVYMTFTIGDGSSGASIELPWAGEAFDTSDKGLAKAATIAMRTFLIDLLQLPADDEAVDPDKEGAQRTQYTQQNGSKPDRPQRPVEAPARQAAPQAAPKAKASPHRQEIFKLGREAGLADDEIAAQINKLKPHQNAAFDGHSEEEQVAMSTAFKGYLATLAGTGKAS